MRPIDVRLRARQRDDLDACAALLREVHAADSYPRKLPPDPVRWLVMQKELAAWVALSDERILGHLALRSTDEGPMWPAWRGANSVEVDRLAVVTRFFVDPNTRNAGVGGALLDLAQDHAAASGLQLVLEVGVQNRDAVSVYDRRGWRRVGTALRPASDGKQPLRVLLFIAPE